MRSITNREPNSSIAWGNLLTKAWGDDRFPVEPAEIALQYSAQRFGNEAISVIQPCGRDLVEGMLTRRKGEKRWIVLYAEYPELPGRQRFTVAHELGHYLLHRSHQAEFRCASEDVLDRVLKEREREANEFASYLLMPIDDFRAQIAGQDFSLDLIRHCAARYGTTFTAAALKWVEFTTQLASVVVARDGFVKWARSSSSAEKRHLLIRSGREVPSGSLFDPSASAFDQSRSKRLAAGGWMPYSETIEHVIVSDKYDLQIGVFLHEPASEYEAIADEEESDLVDLMNAPRFAR
jgi:hypothetical protein